MKDSPSLMEVEVSFHGVSLIQIAVMGVAPTLDTYILFTCFQMHPSSAPLLLPVTISVSLYPQFNFTLILNFHQTHGVRIVYLLFFLI